MAKAHIVNHTHWDREWYFTVNDALVLSDQLFTEVLNELEVNPYANFCMDGQSSIVDDFIELHPHSLNKIQQFVKEGRLFIGPWYAQTDALYTDGESIIRNLMIGIRDTKRKYGTPMKIGYLPDTFGFSPSLPSIFHHVGIDSLLHWRGSNFQRLAPSPYYIWRGAGKRELIGVNFPHGYMTGLITNEAKQQVESYVEGKYDVEVDLLEKTGNNQDVLIPSGMDQKNIVRNLKSFVEKINAYSRHETVISTYPDFVNILRNKKEQLPVYQGELRLPSYSRIHRTIGSVRSQFKIKNFCLEQKILRRIEPLMIISHNCDIHISQELLVKVWKKMFECQAHDSLGGCVSDNVAQDIIHRYKEIDELVDGIENTIKKRMADSLGLHENEIIVFNTDPFHFNGRMEIHVVTNTKEIIFEDIVDAVIVKEKYYPVRKKIVKQTPTGVELIDEPAYYELWISGKIEIPAMGYRVISFNDATKAMQQLSSTQDKMIKNEHYKLEYKHGSLYVERNGKLIKDFIKLVDASNMGDTYDYSPMDGEIELDMNFNSAYVEHANDYQKLVLSGNTNLPIDLVQRNNKSPLYNNFSYTVTLTLHSNSDLIYGEIELNNTVESHRVRLKVNTEINTQESYSQIQNAFVKNVNMDIPIDWKEQFVEKPVNINFMDKSVSTIGDDYTVTVYTKGMKEYEKEHQYLYITLMATTGQLGKPDLAWRPGRASGDTTNQGHIMMPTPLAQEMGINNYSFAVEISEVFCESTIAKNTYKYLHPSISYQKQKLNKFINRLDNKIWPLEHSKPIARSNSFIQLDDKLYIAAIYHSYLDDDSYLVRVVNPTGQKINIEEMQCLHVNALEEELEHSSTIDAYDMLTLKFKY